MSKILSLPCSLTDRYEMRVLADTAFGSIEFLPWVKARTGLNAGVGIRSNRRLATNKQSVGSPI